MMSNPVEEFLKTAGIWGNFMKGLRGEGASGFSGALGSQVPTGVAAAAVTGVGMGIAKGFEKIHDRLTKARDYKSMLQATPDLRHFDASHTQMMYNSLRSLAPTLARDPLVAGSFVRDALRLSPEHGPAIPPATAKMLVETQAKLQGPSLARQMAEAAGKASPLQRIQADKGPQQTGYEEVSTEKAPGEPTKTRSATRKFHFGP